MDAVTNLRTINTQTLLSLVATIFLPLTFLSGVFGMNFQGINAEGISEYYMVMLNDPLGPKYFGIICLGCVFIISSYFVYNGWVDTRVNFKRMFQSCFIPGSFF